MAPARSPGVERHMLFVLLLCVSLWPTGSHRYHTKVIIEQWMARGKSNECLGHSLNFETCSKHNSWQFQRESKFGWNVVSNISTSESAKCLQRENYHSLDLVMGSCPLSSDPLTMWHNEKWILEPSPISRRRYLEHRSSKDETSSELPKSEYILVWREWFRMRQLCLSENGLVRNSKSHHAALTANPKKCAVFNIIRDSSSHSLNPDGTDSSIDLYDRLFHIDVKASEDNILNIGDWHRSLSSIGSQHLFNNIHKFSVASSHQKSSLMSHTQTPLAVKAVALLSPSSSSSSSSSSPSSFPSALSSLFGFTASPVTESTRSTNDVLTASPYNHPANKHTLSTTATTSLSASTVAPNTASSQSKSKPSSGGSKKGWIESRTGMELSYELDQGLDFFVEGGRNSGGTQHLLGGGIYSKWGLPLYMVGLYVESGSNAFVDSVLYAHCFGLKDNQHSIPACDDEYFLEHILDADQLLGNKDSTELSAERQPFFLALSSPAAYDRTLSIKLAMSVSANQVRTGLLSLWQMSSFHKKLLLDASMALETTASHEEEDDGTGKEFKRECCSRGDEVSFTWKGRSGILEMRLNGELLASVPPEQYYQHTDLHHLATTTQTSSSSFITFKPHDVEDVSQNHGIGVHFLNYPNSMELLKLEMDQSTACSSPFKCEASTSLPRAIMYQFTADSPEVSMSLDARKAFAGRVSQLVSKQKVKESYQRLKEWFPMTESSQQNLAVESTSFEKSSKNEEGIGFQKFKTNHHVKVPQKNQHSEKADLHRSNKETKYGSANKMKAQEVHACDIPKSRETSELGAFLDEFAFGGSNWFVRNHHYEDCPQPPDECSNLGTMADATASLHCTLPYPPHTTSSGSHRKRHELNSSSSKFQFGTYTASKDDWQLSSSFSTGFAIDFNEKRRRTMVGGGGGIDRSESNRVFDRDNSMNKKKVPPTHSFRETPLEAHAISPSSAGSYFSSFKFNEVKQWFNMNVSQYLPKDINVIDDIFHLYRSSSRGHSSLSDSLNKNKHVDSHFLEGGWEEEGDHEDVRFNKKLMSLFKRLKFNMGKVSDSMKKRHAMITRQSQHVKHQHEVQVETKQDQNQEEGEEEVGLSNVMQDVVSILASSYYVYGASGMFPIQEHEFLSSIDSQATDSSSHRLSSGEHALKAKSSLCEEVEFSKGKGLNGKNEEKEDDHEEEENDKHYFSYFSIPYSKYVSLKSLGAWIPPLYSWPTNSFNLF